VTAPVAVVLVALTTVEAVSDATPEMRQYPWPRWVMTARTWAAPFRSANTYGLFRVMTATRPEVVIEGSRDGRTWAAYEFRWKPGDTTERPRFGTPHMPRLDWQIWDPFLGRPYLRTWFVNLLDRLLHGTPEVLALLERNPFPDAPPRFVRVTVYDYRFTTPEERAKTGKWWRRYWMSGYIPPVTPDRETGELRLAGAAAPDR
jgi:hypothetical protein